MLGLVSQMFDRVSTAEMKGRGELFYFHCATDLVKESERKDSCALEIESVFILICLLIRWHGLALNRQALLTWLEACPLRERVLY